MGGKEYETYVCGGWHQSRVKQKELPPLRRPLGITCLIFKHGSNVRLSNFPQRYSPATALQSRSQPANHSFTIACTEPATQVFRHFIVKPDDPHRHSSGPRTNIYISRRMPGCHRPHRFVSSSMALDLPTQSSVRLVWSTFNIESTAASWQGPPSVLGLWTKGVGEIGQIVEVHFQRLSNASARRTQLWR